MTDPWMKCCRYCRWYNLEEGICENPKLATEIDNNLEQIIDDGLIIDAIKETADELIYGEEILDDIEAAVIAVLRKNLAVMVTPNSVNPAEYYCNLYE
jgi:hypothetical protein